MVENIKWEGGSFAISHIKETPQEKWVKIHLATASDKAKSLFTPDELEAKLNKIWEDVNGVKKVPESSDTNSETAPKVSGKGGKKE